MQPDNIHVLSATGIDKIFPGARALNRVDFSLRRGEVHALLGENGAGKSTLVKCLTGAYRRDGGRILVDGVDADPQSTLEAQNLGIGTVYQEVNLLANLTVAENLFLGRQPRRFGLVDARAMNSRAKALLAEYDLDIDVTAELPEHFAESMQTLGFDLALGNTDALDDRSPPSREQKKAQARAHAKTVRKERRGERRGRGEARKK